jgi:hypothetical protein
MFRGAIAGLTMAAMMGAAHASQASRQFTCSGSVYEPSGLAPAQKSGRLIISPRDKISLNLGQGDLKTSLMSDNGIQLKFSASEFKGEFFHYTTDLFSDLQIGTFRKIGLHAKLT